MGALSKVGLHAPELVRWIFGANTTGGTNSFAHVADDYYTIEEAYESHATAGSDGGAVTAIIEKLTGTQAPGGGANMLKTASFDLKGVANTVQHLVKSRLLDSMTVAQKAATRLSPGDRIACTTAGTLTALDGVTVVVVLKRTRIAAKSQR